ncbi:unnamed protein product, partial [Nesidiocoris tenuis]
MSADLCPVSTTRAFSEPYGVRNSFQADQYRGIAWSSNGSPALLLNQVSPSPSP